MRRINLLPTARRRGGTGIGDQILFLQNLPPRTWTVAMAVIAFIFAAILAFSVTTQRKSVSNQIVTVESELSELRIIVDEVNDLRSLKKVLDEKMTVVDQLIIGRLCWARFLNEIASVMSSEPEISRRVWLFSMKLVQIRSMEERVVEKKNRKGEMVSQTKRVPVVKSAIELKGQVTGESGATHLVGQLMDLLGKRPIIAEYVEDVELDHIKEAAGQRGAQGKEFQLSLFMRKRNTGGGE